jgi:invasion protein IalB
MQVTRRASWKFDVKAEVVLLVVLGATAAPAAMAQSPAPAERFGDWGLFIHDAAPARICFVAAQPKEQEPKTAKRDPAYFYVSAWPKDGVKGEVSVKLGYPIRKGSEVQVQIGTDTFRLFAAEERAFVGDPTAELKLIEAMKKGARMVVKGTSERGTATTDGYSLGGLSQALAAMVAACS